MLIRVGGWQGGFSNYLETGLKAGRDHSRDELDERVPLSGDLNVFDSVVAGMETKGGTDKYLHFTLSFAEDYIEKETLFAVVEEFRKFVMAAYADDEFCMYAEAHLPRIKSYTNKTTGEHVERFPHIHIGVPKTNLLTGGRFAPLGFEKNAERYIDAFQEYVNAKYGLRSPKDSPRITPADGVEMLMRFGANEFIGQRHLDIKKSLTKKIVSGEINGIEELAKAAAEFGRVEFGRKNQIGRRYVKIYLPGDGGKEKAVRLDAQLFTENFLEKPAAERAQIVHDAAVRSYREAQQSKKSPEYTEPILKEWYGRRALEVKHLHPNSKFYKTVYKDSDEVTKAKILAVLQSRFNQQWRPQHVARSKPTRRVPPPALRNRLHLLPEQPLVPGAARSELLLPSNVPLDLDHAKSATDFKLRRADFEPGRAAAGRETRAGRDDAGSRTGRNSGDAERRGISSELEVPRLTSVVSKSLADLADAYALANSKDQLAEIRRNINPAALLAELSRSHGLDPSLYQVATGKDGTPRIVAGSRKLTPADFLQKEMHLPFGDAAKILRRVYEQQINHVRMPDQVRARSPLWGEFTPAWQATLREFERRRGEAVEAGRAARKALADAIKAERRTLNERPILHTERRALQSLAKLDAARRRADLAADLAARRAAVVLPSPEEAFADWLRDQAQKGRADALAELQRIESKPRRPSSAPALEAAPGAAAAAQILRDLSFTVERNGDVEYRLDGRAALRDEGRRLAVLDPESPAAIRAGLLLAQEKFGNVLTLTGTPEFQRKVVAVAVAQGLRVQFADPQLEALRVELDAKKREPVRTRAKPAAPQPPAAVPVQPAHQVAATPTMAQPDHGAAVVTVYSVGEVVGEYTVTEMPPFPAQLSGPILDRRGDAVLLAHNGRQRLAVSIPAADFGAKPPVVGEVRKVAYDGQGRLVAIVEKGHNRDIEL